jgi:hypothetical protein
VAGLCTPTLQDEQPRPPLPAGASDAISSCCTSSSSSDSSSPQPAFQSVKTSMAEDRGRPTSCEPSKPNRDFGTPAHSHEVQPGSMRADTKAGKSSDASRRALVLLLQAGLRAFWIYIVFVRHTALAWVDGQYHALVVDIQQPPCLVKALFFSGLGDLQVHVEPCVTVIVSCNMHAVDMRCWLSCPASSASSSKDPRYKCSQKTTCKCAGHIG